MRLASSLALAAATLCVAMGSEVGPMEAEERRLSGQPSPSATPFFPTASYWAVNMALSIRDVVIKDTMGTALNTEMNSNERELFKDYVIPAMVYGITEAMKQEGIDVVVYWKWFSFSWATAPPMLRRLTAVPVSDDECFAVRPRTRGLRVDMEVHVAASHLQAMMRANEGLTLKSAAALLSARLAKLLSASSELRDSVAAACSTAIRLQLGPEFIIWPPESQPTATLLTPGGDQRDVVSGHCPTAQQAGGYADLCTWDSQGQPLPSPSPSATPSPSPASTPSSSAGAADNSAAPGALQEAVSTPLGLGLTAAIATVTAGLVVGAILLVRGAMRRRAPAGLPRYGGVLAGMPAGPGTGGGGGGGNSSGGGGGGSAGAPQVGNTTGLVVLADSSGADSGARSGADLVTTEMMAASQPQHTVSASGGMRVADGTVFNIDSVPVAAPMLLYEHGTFVRPGAAAAAAAVASGGGGYRSHMEQTRLATAAPMQQEVERSVDVRTLHHEGDDAVGAALAIGGQQRLGFTQESAASSVSDWNAAPTAHGFFAGSLMPTAPSSSQQQQQQREAGERYASERSASLKQAAEADVIAFMRQARGSVVDKSTSNGGGQQASVSDAEPWAGAATSASLAAAGSDAAVEANTVGMWMEDNASRQPLQTRPPTMQSDVHAASGDVLVGMAAYASDDDDDGGSSAGNDAGVPAAAGKGGLERVTGVGGSARIAERRGRRPMHVLTDETQGGGNHVAGGAASEAAARTDDGVMNLASVASTTMDMDGVSPVPDPRAWYPSQQQQQQVYNETSVTEQSSAIRVTMQAQEEEEVMEMAPPRRQVQERGAVGSVSIDGASDDDDDDIAIDEVLEVDDDDADGQADNEDDGHASAVASPAESSPTPSSLQLPSQPSFSRTPAAQAGDHTPDDNQATDSPTATNSSSSSSSSSSAAPSSATRQPSGVWGRLKQRKQPPSSTASLHRSEQRSRLTPASFEASSTAPAVSRFGYGTGSVASGSDTEADMIV